MKNPEAKKIGARQGLVSAGIGLLIAYIITVSIFIANGDIIHSLFWFVDVDFNVNILGGAIILITASYLLGGVAGEQIIVKRRSPFVIGGLCGIITLLSTAFFSGWIGFFQEGIKNWDETPFFDYVVKPFYWVALFGFLPSLLVGFWMGRRIKKRAPGRLNRIGQSSSVSKRV